MLSKVIVLTLSFVLGVVFYMDEPEYFIDLDMVTTTPTQQTDVKED